MVVLIIFPFILQTDINVIMLSTGRQEAEFWWPNPSTNPP